MLEVPADSLALGVYVQCRFGGPGKVVTECDVLMDPVADGLHSCPPRRGVTEQLPRNVGKSVDFAIPAGEQKLKSFSRQLFDRYLRSIPADRVGEARILDQGGTPEAQRTVRSHDSGANVPETVQVLLAGGVRRDPNLIRLPQVRGPGWMNVQKRNYLSSVAGFRARYRSPIGST